jgi:hypothetical protein
MNNKVKSLREKIYKDFIIGTYGISKIPSETEISKKYDEITSTEYTPIMDNERLENIDIGKINTKFNSALDDLDVMYSSIEKESENILDQLTVSLKEYNGIKRELKKIKVETTDIQSGKLGTDYLKYQYTESFDDVKNINLLRSNKINIDAGIFEVERNSGRLVNLNHYYGHKLEWLITESYSKVIENRYVGANDAAVILDPSDPKGLYYKIITSAPTRLKAAIIIQLTPDEKEVEINSLQIQLDSAITKGFVRVYYRKGYKWSDIPTTSIQEIKNDLCTFNFNSVNATHVKIEFIKDAPDKMDGNEYVFSVYNVAILKADTKRTSVLYSKPITIQPFANEAVIITDIKANIDADIPLGCNVRVYTAQDIKISGQFLDALGNYTDPTFSAIASFDPYVSGYVYLSDITNLSSVGISGLEPFFGLDFNWKQLKISDQVGDNLPSVIEFGNNKSKPLILNSIYNTRGAFLFGDTTYSGGYPQPDVSPVWFASGWCNSSNPNWVYLEPLVASGILVEGPEISGVAYENIEIDGGAQNGQILNPMIAGDPLYSGQWLGYSTGIPFNYNLPDVNRTITFNEYTSSIDGWWRPYSYTVTPDGIAYEYSEVRMLNNSGMLSVLSKEYLSNASDFNFNSIDFYKIYKFGNSSKVIEPTIRLYSYHTAPIEGDGITPVNYPHSWKWSYQTSWKSLTNTKTSVTERSTLNPYYIDILLDGTNETILLDGIIDVKLHNTNVVFTPQIDYRVVDENGTNSGTLRYIDLTPLQTTYPYIDITKESFDYTYSYKVKNDYASTWTTFAIVPPLVENPIISIKNPKSDSSDNIINGVVITDEDEHKLYYNETKSLSNYSITLKNDTTTNKHYKITIYCKSNPATGFSSDTIEGNPYIPYINDVVEIKQGIMLVSNLTSMKLVDMSTLIYDTYLNNDTRFAIYTDFNDETYIVVKEPSKMSFPGYGFNSIKSYYDEYEDAKHKNTGHFVRMCNVSGVSDIIYTTGSKNNIVFKYDQWHDQDYGWNKGQTLSEYPNTIQDFKYSNHSSYDYPIHINKNIEDIGFLYYATAENIPNFYSINYKVSSESDKSLNKLLYKVELDSDTQGNLTPLVRSISFTINN